MKKLHTSVLVIGAGPIGIECSVNLKLNAIDHILVDAKELGSTIGKWSHEVFFPDSAENIEIAKFPYSHRVKKRGITGSQYQNYLREIVESYNLPLYSFHRVTGLGSFTEGGFLVHIESLLEKVMVRTKKIVLATGAMDQPKKAEVPGSDYPFVVDNEFSSHAFFGKKILILGDGGLAVEKALNTVHAGAKPTIFFTKGGLAEEMIDPLQLDEYKSLVEKSQIKVLEHVELKEFTKNGTCLYEVNGAVSRRRFDFVVSCLGYSYPSAILDSMGITVSDEGVPEYSRETMETKVKGIFIAGSAAEGTAGSERYFSNPGHTDIKKIMKSLIAKPTLKLGPKVEEEFKFEGNGVQNN